LHTGGTLGMARRSAAGALTAGEPAELLAGLPEARAIAQVEARALFNLDSSDVGIPEWQAIASAIEQELDRFDGFVVLHGTDTMVYTAAALSYMLVNLPKPVVLTGAQRPLAELRTDARNNLISALELATMDVPEVGIFFDHALFRGNRAKKVSVHEFAAFASPNYPVLAEVGLDVTLRHDAIRRPSGLFSVHRDFSDRVLTLRVTPGMHPDLLAGVLAGPAEAIVLEAFGAGNVPSRPDGLLSFIAQATERGKLVAIATQALSGAVDLRLYECGRQAEAAGAVSCRDMTVEAAVVKLMFLLGQFGSVERARRNLLVPLAGEVSG
jgi:L-asparaginase